MMLNYFVHYTQGPKIDRKKNKYNALMKIGRLHVLTDFHFQQQYTHQQLAYYAIQGGADVIQFRQKKGAIRHKFHEAQLTAELCTSENTPLLINDHVDMAMALKTAGVHLGRADFPLQEAREILGDDYIIGATANSIKDVHKVKDLPIDYIGFGPMYSSYSKEKPGSTQSMDTLREVCSLTPLPIIAISGIQVDRLSELFDSGVHGIAVMTAITTAENPQAATERFRNEIDRLV